MNRVLWILEEHGAETEMDRPADYQIKFGVTSDEGDGDEWPGLLEKIKAADILLIGTSIWFGHRNSIAQMVIERLAAPTTSGTRSASTRSTTRSPAWS